MNKANFFISTLVFITILMTACDESYAPFSTQQVRIGNQIWMAENLNVTKFRNGDIIPEARSDQDWKKANYNKQPAWCYYENHGSNGRKYGKLYNWFAVTDQRGLAPEGWHIADNQEWTMLEQNLVKEHASLKMKSREEWIENGNGTNESGFNALPGGARTAFGTFTSIFKSSWWWSSNGENSSLAWAYSLHYYHRSLDMNRIDSGSGFYVRCVKDRE